MTVAPILAGILLLAVTIWLLVTVIFTVGHMGFWAVGFFLAVALTVAAIISGIKESRP
jgi:hypothetical protein